MPACVVFQPTSCLHRCHTPHFCQCHAAREVRQRCCCCAPPHPPSLPAAAVPGACPASSGAPLELVLALVRPLAPRADHTAPPPTQPHPAWVGPPAPPSSPPAGAPAPVIGVPIHSSATTPNDRTRQHAGHRELPHPSALCASDADHTCCAGTSRSSSSSLNMSAIVMWAGKAATAAAEHKEH